MCQLSSVSLPQLAYKGVPVVTTETLARAYEVDAVSIRKNFSCNKGRFTEGKHYFSITGKELNTFRLSVTESNSQISPKVRALTLWTERGAARHAKMLNSDKAWDMFELLEETFFRVAAQQSDDLSIEARRPLSVLIGQWAGKAKISFPDCWRELHTVFGISTVGELPSSQLPAAMAWVQAKIDGLPSSVPVVAPERKPAKPVPVARELKDLMAAQSKIDLLIQLVQLGGLRGFSTADDPTMQALVKSRNEHIRAASNCLIMAKQAIKAALA